MQKWLAVVIAAAGLLVAGCQFKADPDIEAVSLRAFDLVRRDDRAQLDALLAPDLKTPVAKQQFTQVIAMLPKTAPRASKFVGQQKFMSATGETTATTTYEHAYPDRIVRAQTSLFRSSDRAPWIVRGFHVQVATLGELAVNDFSFAGKTARHYVALALLLLSPAVMIGALIKVVRTPGLKRKWLWGILAFAGLFSFQFNWTTGAWGFSGAQFSSSASGC